ncbi:MAG TPA: DUF5996 family protein [Casimicrobiaceae bacterium]|nr:DUF5996 family protein [Casimicrobiaceae bacterium]
MTTDLHARGAWPALPLAEWRETCETLHLYAQVVGKVRLAATPWLNHSWHVPLYVTARGLTTSPIFVDERALEVHFDFVDHRLTMLASDGRRSDLPLVPRTVAEFYDRVGSMLRALDFDVRIGRMPNEIPKAVPFDEDTTHRAYDPEYANRFWRVLLQAARVFALFRTAFLGKSSPVHFFWGSFDLAVTRFSGRAAPLHAGGVPHLPDPVVREAYSHEVSSAGFWPGGNGIDASFYSYAYPEPPGFRDASVQPASASFNATLGEFLLPYEAVRSAADPANALLAFLQTTYEAAANAANWDRGTLDCAPGRPQVPRSVT